LSAPDGVSPKFTGQDRDQETVSDDWFQVRYMDGAQGRFQSVDPGNAGANLGDPQTWNGYSYVGNNPLSYTDPSGMMTLAGTGATVGAAACGPVCAGVGAAIGAIADGLALWAVFGHGGPPPTISSSLVTPVSPIIARITTYATAPRNQNCVNAYAAGGSVIGAAAGAEIVAPIGAAGGAAGGTLVLPVGGTIAGGAGGYIAGGVAGGIAGGAVGTAAGAGVGWLMCSTSNASPTSSGGADSSKSPGQPTAKEGYTPPKRGAGSNGEMVKNPNGPGRGYPDDKGRVWMPTGEGPLAHGGPHWDVQIPGGGYINVYPGGGVR
jgi:RHS repeat-associated protein